jgi:hypothetical protein
MEIQNCFVGEGLESKQFERLKVHGYCFGKIGEEAICDKFNYTTSWAIFIARPQYLGSRCEYAVIDL